MNGTKGYSDEIKFFKPLQQRKAGELSIKALKVLINQANISKELGSYLTKKLDEKSSGTYISGQFLADILKSFEEMLSNHVKGYGMASKNEGGGRNYLLNNKFPFTITTLVSICLVLFPKSKVCQSIITPGSTLQPRTLKQIDTKIQSNMFFVLQFLANVAIKESKQSDVPALSTVNVKKQINTYFNKHGMNQATSQTMIELEAYFKCNNLDNGTYFAFVEYLMTNPGVEPTDKLLICLDLGKDLIPDNFNLEELKSRGEHKTILTNILEDYTKIFSEDYQVDGTHSIN